MLEKSGSVFQERVGTYVAGPVRFDGSGRNRRSRESGGEAEYTAAGEAEAIRKVAEAKAKEIEDVYSAMMKSKPDDRLVQLKSLEALKEVANGESNKVFIPFEATSALGSLGAIKEVMSEDKKHKEHDKDVKEDNEDESDDNKKE